MRRCLYKSNTLLALAILASSCTYLQHVKDQKRLSASLRDDPELWTVKHLLERETFFVYGKLSESGVDHDQATSLAVAACSSAYKPDEIVDVCHLGRRGSYYALNIPPGAYELIFLRDLDGDRRYASGEIVARIPLELNDAAFPDRIARLDDVVEGLPHAQSLATLPLVAPEDPDRGAQESLFYPRGTIRSLDDPIFDPQMSELGMYDPAAFTEVAPLMFYALEEDFGYKIPVIFVHGIGGSARSFAPIVASLDRSRFKPWFFHYPSGGDLDQLGSLFYDIFLSGKVIPASPLPVVIVAHSMGGLVVREALNHYTRDPSEANVRMFASIASPFGGMASASAGVRRAPLVVPAWRDLDSQGDFVARLFRNPLPPGIDRPALFACRSLAAATRRKGSDGVVPVSSQLALPAQAEFTSELGFETEHAEILRDPGAISHVVGQIASVPNLFPDIQLATLDRGGFAVSLDEAYSPMDAYFIHNYGFCLRALALGTLAPFHPEQAHFVAVARGEATPSNPAEAAWTKFQRDFPEIANASD